MSDESDDEFNNVWIPYSSRSEWSDIIPISQDDGKHPVVPIAYTSKFREIFDYFRAILANQEKSLRALELTRDALSLNVANYTVWQYRRDILRELDCDLNEELEYIEEVIYENPKNYQVWHHRRVIVEMSNDASRELTITGFALDKDAKNYHAWQHRQWAIKTYMDQLPSFKNKSSYDVELDLVDQHIKQDIRNNSAWNHRFFVLQNFNELTPEVIQRELCYTMKCLDKQPENESVWNYLVGILRQNEDGALDQFPKVIQFSEYLYENGNRSRYLLAFLIDLYQEQCLKNENANEREKLSVNIYTLCNDMSKEHDVIRRKYWKYVSDQFKKKLDEKQL